MQLERYSTILVGYRSSCPKESFGARDRREGVSRVRFSEIAILRVRFDRFWGLTGKAASQTRKQDSRHSQPQECRVGIRPEPVTHIGHQKRLLQTKAADGAHRCGPSAKRRKIGRAFRRSRILKAVISRRVTTECMCTPQHVPSMLNVVRDDAELLQPTRDTCRAESA